MQKLPRTFYTQDTLVVAKSLLGKFLVRRRQENEFIGKIVEVEAYLGAHDLACHSSKGSTPRTQIMFGPAGYSYVYLIYGIHHCFNIVTEQEGIGSAVLIRALEPIKNIQGRTQGPGLLTKAMHINKQLNGHDLLSDSLFIAAPETPNTHFNIVERPRIGVDYAGEWAHKLLRFYIKGNGFISRK